MKLSVFTTVSHDRGDTFVESMRCYSDLADEVVVVDGSGSIYKKIEGEYKFYTSSPEWEKEFDWPFIGQQFQRGYEACTGDWVIHADLDMIFHESKFQELRTLLERYSDYPAVSFPKRQFILPDRYGVKSRLIVAVNKGKFGNRIRFDSGGDLCQPSLDGKYIETGTVPDLKIPIWNYECLLKTKEQIVEDKGRFARAWQRHFGEYKLGGPDDESAYAKWLIMVEGRYRKPQQPIDLYQHPKYMQNIIRDLKPEQWGYSGFGLVKGTQYVQSS